MVLALAGDSTMTRCFPVASGTAFFFLTGFFAVFFAIFFFVVFFFAKVEFPDVRSQ